MKKLVLALALCLVDTANACSIDDWFWTYDPKMDSVSGVGVQIRAKMSNCRRDQMIKIELYENGEWLGTGHLISDLGFTFVTTKRRPKGKTLTLKSQS